MPTEGNRSKRHRGIKHGPKPSSTKTGTSSSYYITSSTGAYETPEDLVRLTRHCNELGAMRFDIVSSSAEVLHRGRWGKALPMQASIWTSKLRAGGWNGDRERKG